MFNLVFLVGLRVDVNDVWLMFFLVLCLGILLEISWFK